MNRMRFDLKLNSVVLRKMNRKFDACSTSVVDFIEVNTTSIDFFTLGLVPFVFKVKNRKLILCIKKSNNLFFKLILRWSRFWHLRILEKLGRGRFWKTDLNAAARCLESKKKKFLNRKSQNLCERSGKACPLAVLNRIQLVQKTSEPKFFKKTWSHRD